MSDLCVVSAKPYNVSQTGKAKPRKRKANSLGVLSSVTDWIYPGGNKKLNKDATTDPYAKKKKRKPKKRTNPRKVRSASSLSRAELKKIRINLNMRDATDAETKDAVRAYINDGGRISELLPTRKRAKKNAPKKRKRKVNAKRKTAKKRTAPRKKTNARKPKARRKNPTYKIFEKIQGKVWRQVNEIDAKSGAAAIRANKREDRIRGNVAPSGTKYKATKL